ncbi:MAG TPA: glycosyltransferase [Methylomirabilota bacterium]|nr:glycosyltransferase [Methylomirabilota bacterium]
MKLSIIVPTWNEEGNIVPLITRIHETLSKNKITYEILFVDDHSTDKTRAKIKQYSKKYPIRLFLKLGKKGKAQSLIEGFSYANYKLLCMIDADLQYPPEDIPAMIAKIEKGADVVVANRKVKHTDALRTFISNANRIIFSKFLHGLDLDVQAGFKVFKKEIIERTTLSGGKWAIDMELLIHAKNAGYHIVSHDITFAKRDIGGTKINLLQASWEIGMNSLMLRFFRRDIIPFHRVKLQRKGRGFHYNGEEFIHHSLLSIKNSAFHRFSGMQILVLIGIFAILTLGLLINWHTTVLSFVAALTFLYFADLLFNLYLIIRSFSKPAEITISDEELATIADKDWPTYTVFCPLYKEWQVLSQFVTSMSRLDYPKDKLQVMLLLEENDTETIKQVKKYNLPAYFAVVIVPDSQPKTKPKACNYGLKLATGEYTVIYDAEDVPDPLQLKKAVLAFEKAGEKTICVQAKLNFYNPHQNLLTRVFTAEYSLWFDLVLTGLQSIHAPIPLGGTSNHFRTKDLHTLKGWDSFNVTEDADLGMRLVKAGYTTAIVDSVTLEEANSSLTNWFGQRSRWIKGYMQTYLVHSRSLSEFLKHKGTHLITFQLVIGGKVMSMFINPLMWAVTIGYFALRGFIGPTVESFFPMPVLYMGVFSLVLGNFLYLYYYMIGCAKHGHDELVKYVFLVPFYWLAMSVAAWIALFMLITAPHHWSKTKHGLHLKSKKATRQAKKKIGDELVDEQYQGLVPNLAN